MHVTRGAISAEPASLLKKMIDPASVGITSSRNHYVNFLECVRDREQPVSDIQSGHRATCLGNAADIAIRLGRKLRWNPATDQFEGDDEANRRRAEPMRSPWSLS